MIDKNIVKKGIIVLTVGIAVTAVIMMFTDFKTAFLQLMEIPPIQSVFILSLIPINYLIKYLRYHYYLRLMGYKIRVADELFSLLSSFVMVITPGKLGETLLRGYLLQKCNYKIGISSIISLTLADRLTEGIAMATLVLLTIASLKSEISILAVIIVGIGLLMIGIILQKETWIMSGIEKLEKIRKLAPVTQKCRMAYQETKVIYRLQAFLLSTAMGIVSWCCEGGVVYFTALALGNELSFSQGVFAVSLSGIFAAISMIPGGIGIADGTTLGVLLLFHIPYDIAGGITLVSRFPVMWLGVLIGAMTLIVGWKKWTN